MYFDKHQAHKWFKNFYDVLNDVQKESFCIEVVLWSIYIKVEKVKQYTIQNEVLMQPLGRYKFLQELK